MSLHTITDLSWSFSKPLGVLSQRSVGVIATNHPKTTLYSTKTKCTLEQVLISLSAVLSMQLLVFLVIKESIPFDCLFKVRSSLKERDSINVLFFPIKVHLQLMRRLCNLDQLPSMQKK